MKLSEVSEGDEVVILRMEENKELFNYLTKLNINLKEKYVVNKKDPFEGPIYLQNEEEIKAVAFKATEMIEVYKI